MGLFREEDWELLDYLEKWIRKKYPNLRTRYVMGIAYFEVKRLNEKLERIYKKGMETDKDAKLEWETILEDSWKKFKGKQKLEK